MRRRSFKTIRTRLYRALNPKSPSSVRAADKLSKYVRGGAGAIAAFQLKLNGDPGFKEDGLSLGPGAVSADAKVANQLEAIVRDYHRRGWEVV